MLQEEVEKIVIECGCGTHLLQVTSDTDYFGTDGDNPVQSFYLAMFTYGGSYKESLLKRLKIAWKFIRTGEMYSDQIVLTTDEAKKLIEFFNKELKE